MPDVNWIFEKDVFDGNMEKMYSYVVSRGMRAIPTGSLFLSDLFGDDACVIVYGSINLVDDLYRKKPWTPTAWYDIEKLSCRYYYAMWGKYLLQQRYAFIPFGELTRKADWIYELLGEEDKVFVRPDSNKKIFTGMVLSKGDFLRWHAEETNCYGPDPWSMVVLSRPDSLVGEWRLVVSRGEIITGSPCPIPEEVSLLAQEVAQHPWQPEDIYVLDVAMTSSRGARVVEIGSVNCAALYDCDVEVVVDCMCELAVERWEEVMVP